MLSDENRKELTDLAKEALLDASQSLEKGDFYSARVHTRDALDAFEELEGGTPCQDVTNSQSP